jgi:regulatory protein
VPKITALKVQKHNSNRLNVYIDGEFAFGVERLVGAWLNTGDEIDKEKIENLLQKDELEKAYLRALRLIDTRPRSTFEVASRLKKAGYGDTVIASVLDRLKIANLVGDADFARIWVENRCIFRPRSKRALVLELHQKGVADSEIQPAICDLDETTLALQTAEKYASRCRDLPFDEFRKKMSGYLARRGFDYGTVQEAIQQAWESNRVEADILL